MNNKEKILKYLSGLMTPEEQSKFEKELSESAVLYEEYTAVERKLNALKECADINTEEMYFNALLPRVREKLEKPKRRLIPKLSVASAFAVVILVFSLVYFPNVTSTNNGENSGMDISSILASLDSSTLDELLDNNYIHEYSAYYDKSFLKEISEFSDDIEYSADAEEYDASLYYNGTTTELINDMTSEELEDVYQTLLDKKFL